MKPQFYVTVLKHCDLIENRLIKDFAFRFSVLYGSEFGAQLLLYLSGIGAGSLLFFDHSEPLCQGCKLDIVPVLHGLHFLFGESTIQISIHHLFLFPPELLHFKAQSLRGIGKIALP